MNNTKKIERLRTYIIDKIVAYTKYVEEDLIKLQNTTDNLTIKSLERNIDARRIRINELEIILSVICKL